jgi:hypothetical protein
MPANDTKNARYTTSTATPRGRRERCTKPTAGLRISAIRPATMNSRRTLPAALASRYSATMASGNSTSCTQRTTIVRGGGSGALTSCASPASGASARSSSPGGSASGCPTAAAFPLTVLPPSPQYG